MARLITLEAWARETYGDSSPSIFTLRRWAKDGKIFPAAEKQGRSFFVSPDAVYINPKSTLSELRQRFAGEKPNAARSKIVECLSRRV